MAGNNSKTPPGNAPITAYEKARYEWYERNGSPVVDKNRYAFLLFISFVVIISLGYAISHMLPLVRVVPYVVKTDNFGAVRADHVATQNFKPELAQIKYFIAEFVTKWWSIDPVLLDKDLSAAFLRTRGQAIEEFKSWIKSDRPIERLNLANKLLTRTVTITSLAPISENIMQVRFQTTERPTNGQPPIIKNRVVIVHFAMIPPVSEAEILQNPLGLFVTHFALSEEIN